MDGSYSEKSPEYNLKLDSNTWPRFLTFDRSFMWVGGVGTGVADKYSGQVNIEGHTCSSYYRFLSDFESNCSDAKEEKAKLSPGPNFLRQNSLKILTCQAGRQLGWGDIK